MRAIWIKIYGCVIFISCLVIVFILFFIFHLLPPIGFYVEINT